MKNLLMIKFRNYNLDRVFVPGVIESQCSPFLFHLQKASLIHAGWPVTTLRQCQDAFHFICRSLMLLLLCAVISFYSLNLDAASMLLTVSKASSIFVLQSFIIWERTSCWMLTKCSQMQLSLSNRIICNSLYLCLSIPTNDCLYIPSPFQIHLAQSITLKLPPTRTAI